MKNRINTRKQLKARIHALNKQMDIKEGELKSDLNDVHQSLRASNMIRNAIKDIREQPALRVGMAQAAADMGAHMVIDRVVFRKHRNLRNYLLSILFKKIADHFILKESRKMQPKHSI